MKKKLTECQNKRLKNALSICRDMGYEIIGWNPDICVMSPNGEKDRDLISKLKNLEMNLIFEPDEDTPGMMTFSFFPHEHNTLKFAKTNIIYRSFSEKFMWLILLVILAAAFVGVIMSNGWQKRPLLLFSPFFLMFVIYQGLQIFIWKIEFQPNELKLHQLFKKQSVAFSDILSIKTRTRIYNAGAGGVTSGKIITIELKNGHKVQTDELGLNFAENVQSEIQRRVDIWKGS